MFLVCFMQHLLHICHIPTPCPLLKFLKFVFPTKRVLGGFFLACCVKLSSFYIVKHQNDHFEVIESKYCQSLNKFRWYYTIFPFLSGCTLFQCAWRCPRICSEHTWFVTCRAAVSFQAYQKEGKKSEFPHFFIFKRNPAFMGPQLTGIAGEEKFTSNSNTHYVMTTCISWHALKAGESQSASFQSNNRLTGGSFDWKLAFTQSYITVYWV